MENIFDRNVKQIKVFRHDDGTVSIERLEKNGILYDEININNVNEGYLIVAMKKCKNFVFEY